MQSVKAETKAEAFDWKSLVSVKGASIIAATAVAVGGVTAFSVSKSIAESNRVISGVKTDGVEISGLSEKGTRQYFEKLGKDKTTALKFSYGDQTFSIEPSEINLTPNVDQATKDALHYGRENVSTIANMKDQIKTALNGKEVKLTANYDENLLNEKLNAIAAQVNQQPVNAYCDLDSNGNVLKYAGIIGKKLDTAKIAESLKEPLNSLNIPSNIDLTPEDVMPFVTTEDIMPIDTVLGQYTTSFSLGARGDNIALAASKLNDKIVKPGWTFSFNDTVGERTYSAGYQTAGVIIDGRAAQDVGGGVCQVSTTLYNAILLAGLTPIERTPHYFQSSYVAYGRDATVADGQIDFKFRNDLPHNVYLLAGAYGPSVTVYVLGTRADLNGANIRIESEGASIYRAYYKDGQRVKDEFLHTDSYHTS